MPAKFLIPGTIFLIGFQMIPIIFTINVAFSNYSTGHILTKSQAIEAIKINSLQPPENGRQFDIAPAQRLIREARPAPARRGKRQGVRRHDQGPHAALCRATSRSATTGRSRRRRVTRWSRAPSCSPRPAAPDVQRADDRRRVDPAAGHRSGGRAAADAALRPGERTSSSGSPTARCSTTTAGLVRRRQGAGAEELEPGWKTHVGFRNFTRIIHDPLVRKPFLSIFAWTFVFAASLRPLLLRGRAVPRDRARQAGDALPEALPLDPGRIPYAIPGFLSLLVWAGLLNDDFGVVNNSVLAHHTCRGSSAATSSRGCRSSPGRGSR